LFRRGPSEVNFRLIQEDITLPGTQPDERLGDNAGSIAIKGRTLVVGSRLRNAVPGQFDTGIVHVLRRSPTGVWSAIADTLRVPSSEGLSELGFSVATNGGRIIVGVPGENRAIIARIAGEQIIEESVSVQPDPDFEGSRYGATVAMGPGTQPAIVVGAPDDRIGDLGFAGSAYGFSGSWDPCAADLDSSGTVDLVDLSLLLASWGASGVIDGEPSADLDADGVVKSSDMQRLLQAWGGCGG
jgi:hypothetical protein